MVTPETAAQGKDFAMSFSLLPGCAKWAHLENEGTMSQTPPPTFGNTKETSKFTLDIEAGGFEGCGMDDDAVEIHKNMQDVQLEHMRRIEREMAMKAWENDEVLVKAKEEMVKIFIDDNEHVKKMKKSDQPKACDPKAMTAHPNLRKQWMRKCMATFPVTGSFPPMVKMKCKAYKPVWRNNKNTGELMFNPPPVTDMFGAQLNAPGGPNEPSPATGESISTAQRARHVKQGDLVQVQVQMKMWVVQQNCGIKLDIVRVKKLADGPGESKGFADDVPTDMYASLKRQKTAA